MLRIGNLGYGLSNPYPTIIPISVSTDIGMIVIPGRDTDVIIFRVIQYFRIVSVTDINYF